MAAVTKTEDGKKFPASDYAYIPDPKSPSTWKLRLTATPGGDPDPTIVGAAAAALGPGFRGQKVKIPEADLPAVVARVRAAWRKANPDKDAADLPDAIAEAYDPDSLDGRREATAQAIRSHLGADGPLAEGGVWVAEVYDDAVIVEKGQGSFLRYPYTRAADGGFTFGDPEPVEARAGWTRPATEAAPADGPIVQFSETVPGGGLLESLDNGAGKVWRVTMIRPGTSLNGRRYRREVLAEAVSLYEGVKAFDGHRTPAEQAASGLSKLAGWHENVGVGPQGELQSDFHVADSAPHVRQILLEAWAAKRPDMIGFSHNARGPQSPAIEGGRTISDVTRIVGVDSVDVVADPAAGGRLERLVASRQGGNAMTAEELKAFLEGLSDEDAAIVKAHPRFSPAPPAEPAPPAAPAAVPAAPVVAEAVYPHGSIAQKLVLAEALKDRKLPAAVETKLTEAIGSQDLTEAEIVSRVTEAADLWSSVLAARPSPLPGQATVEVGTEQADNLRKALDGMFANAPIDGVRPFRSLKEAYSRFTGRNPYTDGDDDFARRILAESVGCVPYPGERLTESIAAATWSTALGDSITRKAIKDYLAGVEAWGDWRKIVSDIVPVTDFRTQRREGLGYYNVLSTVAEGAPYPALTSPSDEEATYAVTKKGGVDDLTREAIANDDIGYIRRIPQRLGRSAALTLAYAIWVTLIQGNATIYDALALFEAGTHANLGSAALASAGLTSSRTAMVGQKAPGETSGVAGILPAFICYPSALFATQHALLNPAPGRTSEEPWSGLRSIEVPLWSDANDWLLVADPGTVPTIEVGFMNGRQEPEVIVQDAPAVGSVFTADKVTYKVRHEWGLAVLDYRGFYWNEVT